MHMIAIGKVPWVIATMLMTYLVGALPAVAKDRIILNRFGPSAAELYIANADGTGERKLLATSELDYSPSFSRDGKWIVFASERNGSADIYRVHLDGSGLERLTDDPAFDDQAVLSPDGSRLAFVSTRATGTADIWSLELKSRKLRNLTRGAGGNFRPNWSPDGRWIAFSSDRNTSVRRRSTMDFEQVQEASIYVMQPDGEGLTKKAHTRRGVCRLANVVDGWQTSGFLRNDSGPGVGCALRLFQTEYGIADCFSECHHRRTYGTY
jgi:Tol biopolymer transport system component